MSLTQIAAGAGMQPSKAHRYLVSLARVGLVAQSPSSGRYDMGPSMRRLGVESLRRMDEVALVSEHLTELRDRTSHAVNLAVWGDHGPVVVRWEYGAHALPITVRVGATMPLLTSAMGGAFLSPICPNRSPNPCCAGSCRRRRWTRRPGRRWPGSRKKCGAKAWDRHGRRGHSWCHLPGRPGLHRGRLVPARRHPGDAGTRCLRTGTARLRDGTVERDPGHVRDAGALSRGRRAETLDAPWRAVLGRGRRGSLKRSGVAVGQEAGTVLR